MIWNGDYPGTWVKGQKFKSNGERESQSNPVVYAAHEAEREQTNQEKIGIGAHWYVPLRSESREWSKGTRELVGPELGL